MAALSERSRQSLATCDGRLQRIASIAIREMDFLVTEGHRNKERQEACFAAGTTKLHYPYGNHNRLPSYAFDALPFPLPAEWGKGPMKQETILRFHLLAGVIKGVAISLGYKIRWGGDFDMNNLPDDKWKDYPHFEIWEPKNV